LTDPIHRKLFCDRTADAYKAAMYNVTPFFTYVIALLRELPYSKFILAYLSSFFIISYPTIPFTFFLL
jgi:hypothetical protein